MIVQKLKKTNEDNYQLAMIYYNVISSVNSLSLTKREIQLVAYTAINGSISYSHVKEEFCKKYNTSVQTIYNIVSRLIKIRVLIKDNRKFKVNPVIALKFNDNIKLEITLLYG